MLTLRKTNDRGGAEHGWLKSKHTFSFADYHAPDFMGFGPLRVINEDWIQGGEGFGMHPHKDMEIITYVVKGALEHKDSMGNQAVILPGEVQKMSAGKGVLHSEYSPRKGEDTHLLQIWIHPNKKGLTPSYQQKSFEEQLNTEKLVLVVSPDAELGSLSISQDAKLYVSRLKADDSLDYQLGQGRVAWLQMVKGELKVNSLELSVGDGLAVRDEELLSVVAQKDSEFLLFDLSPSF
ncbi:MAG: pirin family protein [Bdellovibrionota bacterium]